MDRKRVTILGLAGLFIISLVGLGGGLWLLTSMPGQTFQGEAAPLSAKEQRYKENLRQHVEKLAGEIGERNLWTPDAYRRAREYISEQFAAMGYEVHRQGFTVRQQECFNLAVKLPGTSSPEEVLVVGAHYDTVQGSPGANDNASGVALTLELARAMKNSSPEQTIHFVAFANEEPPFFQSEQMGSYQYAEKLNRSSKEVRAMWALETVGYYSEEPGSQHYPPAVGWFYPERGNFIGFVGDLSRRSLVQKSVKQFRKQARIPSEAAALPGLIPQVGWSDHWAFWQFGVPAIMVTDTAPFRYPYYHSPADRPEHVDYTATTRVLTGFLSVLQGN